VVAIQKCPALTDTMIPATSRRNSSRSIRLAKARGTPAIGGRQDGYGSCYTGGALMISDAYNQVGIG
jgi:hypothetical protein